MNCPILKCLPLKYRWLRKSGLTVKSALTTAKVESEKTAWCKACYSVQEFNKNGHFWYCTVCLTPEGDV